MIALGIGLTSAVDGAAIAALARRALAHAGLEASVLAVPDWRADLPAVAAAARLLGLPVAPVLRAAMQTVEAAVVTRSPESLARYGVGSVAEAAALVAAGRGARLLVARLAAAGATCAVAEGEGP
ncbi:Cobalamin synthesis G C-terminus [Chelatococcus sambhunathii]|uniref:Cobalamin synthesis G C-terminus n=1 Tax=Chelatococcus sambhunathii TaxID=363953 RepID=A0ABP2A4Y5_9HYPH|nr:cobalamin biosynthesis protein [Chelatococcus sambhunathii]CUA88988.1 Cobalamin synthesis G C-terminus [Chelatococcus sambhunathii]